MIENDHSVYTMIEKLLQPRQAGQSNEPKRKEWDGNDFYEQTVAAFGSSSDEGMQTDAPDSRNWLDSYKGNQELREAVRENINAKRTKHPDGRVVEEINMRRTTYRF